MGISKSLYINGMQCPKLLWLSKHRKGDGSVFAPDASLEAVFGRGNEVGKQACKLFKGGERIEWEGTSFDEKIAKTKELIERGVRYIYEATFSFGGALIMVDILEVCADGSLIINEVKSSTSVSPVYMDDTAFQYFVLTSLGYNVKAVNLIHLNSEYVRGDELDLKALFVINDLTENAKEQFDNVRENIARFERILEFPNEPECDIDMHCYEPYTCGAFEYCWAGVAQGSVFDIGSKLGVKFYKKDKFALWHSGIRYIDEITDISSFPAYQQIQLKAHKEKSRILNANAVREFLDTLSYPLYHLDFETFQSAIPLWRGAKPYEQTPFQYSLHIDKGDGSELEHKEFLPTEFCDPRRALALSLVRDIPKGVCSLAYNAQFEKGVLKRLAELFPDLSEHLMDIHNNMKDLMEPFAKRDFYDWRQNGSYSIKKIQPILAPSIDDGYKAMASRGEISNGGEAMNAFPAFATMNSEQIAKKRKELLAYCGLDTLAMVKVLEGLKELVK